MFHELIHAHRGALRLSLNPADGTPLGGGLLRYHSEEEFLAVVLTNIYISDDTNRHLSGLRADPAGAGSAPYPQPTRGSQRGRHAC